LIVVFLAACGKPATTPAPVATAVSTLTLTEIASSRVPIATATPVVETSAWFRDAILYEAFPRSFYDSDGDGVGDLKGITAKLDYIQDVGANTLWLTSVFSSTGVSGFDVVDYSIAPALGAKGDLVELIRQAHSRHMRVVMDLPIAYTSNQSPLFKDALGKLKSQYSDWYRWTNAAHTAYEANANLRTLPLLNHKSSAVQTLLFQLAQDWLNIGVDGFHLNDAASVPHEFWKLFRQAVQTARPGAVLFADVWESDPAKLAPYFQDEFDALFDVPVYLALTGSTDRIGGGLLNGSGATANLNSALAATKYYSPTAQLIHLTSAHNTNRIASIVRQDASRARMAAVLAFTLPGALSIYYGDEIGMPGYAGMGTYGDEYRRAPMDWTKSGKGTGAATWFKDASKVIKPNDGVSVEEQQNAQDSLLKVYQMLAARRAGSAALRSTNFQAVASPCQSCYAYMRWDANDFYLVALNLSNQTQSITLDLTKTPIKVTGFGLDLFRGGQVSMPSDGRYTLTIDAWGARVLYWGKR
jgi:glycosidase